MNTKKILNKTFAVAALAVSALGMSSCSDFLEITPMNEVVLEKFWVKKADANKALMGCYESLFSDDNVSRMGMWGEIRSDNIKRGSGASYEVEQILQEKILPTFSICNWGSFYQTINRCNTFCYYAPSVCQKDPNYSESEMKSQVAEAVAIRSLCYFYLARTFREVPFSRQASLDDTQSYVRPAEKFENILDSLIFDLKSVEADAALRYYNYETSDYIQGNVARVTRPFIHALLSEIYLWKGDYDNCIEYGKKVLEFKQKQYKSLMSLYPKETQRHMALFGEYPLITETIEGEQSLGNAYNEIFGSHYSYEFSWIKTRGFSFESIFELSYQNNKSKTTGNTYVFGQYCPATQNSESTKDVAGPFCAPEEFLSGLPDAASEYFQPTDCRAYEFIDASNANRHSIRKYVVSEIGGMTTTNSAKPVLNMGKVTTKTDGKLANWIIYRLTDVMLLMAEAYVEKGNYDAAYELVSVVNARANNKKLNADYTGSTIDKTNYTSLEEWRKLVLEERHRELMFEGKRWYDLVRHSRRVGNTNYLAQMSSIKQLTNGGTVINILANPDILYLPYSREELKLNSYLKQNKAYNLGFDDEIKNN